MGDTLFWLSLPFMWAGAFVAGYFPVLWVMKWLDKRS